MATEERGVIGVRQLANRVLWSRAKPSPQDARARHEGHRAVGGGEVGPRAEGRQQAAAQLDVGEFMSNHHLE